MPRASEEKDETEPVLGPAESKRPRHRVLRDRQWTVEQRDRETEPETGDRK